MAVGVAGMLHVAQFFAFSTGDTVCGTKRGWRLGAYLAKIATGIGTTATVGVDCVRIAKHLQPASNNSTMPRPSPISPLDAAEAPFPSFSLQTKNELVGNVAGFTSDTTHAKHDVVHF